MTTAPMNSILRTTTDRNAAEWSEVAMSELIVEFRGGAPLKPSDFTRSGAKVLPKGAVGRTGWLQLGDGDQQYCSRKYAANHKGNSVDETYIIVVLRDLVPSGPSIGLMVQIRESDAFVLAQGVYGFKVNGNVTPKYLIHLSNTSWYRQLMNSIMVGSTQVHITNTAFKQIKIPLPAHLKDQHVIAEALSDADALIEGLELLISKKRAIKKGAMQELLTGERRLPGFKGEWKLVRLGELFEITSSKRIFQRQWKSQGVPFYRARELAVIGLTGSVDNELYIEKSLYHSIKQAFGVPQIGDMLVTGVGTLGKTFVIRTNDEFYFKDGNIIWFKIKGAVDSEYLRQMFLTDGMTKQIADQSAGTTVGTYTISGAKKTEILAPSLNEQTAIANVLFDMDIEIDTLEAKIIKARQVKQGMMQELLTGRIRLV